MQEVKVFHAALISTSHVGHDQSLLMENLSNRLSHHCHLLLCCPSSLPFFSWIFLSVQIGSCTNQLIQCKVHEIFFPTSLHLPKTHSNWGSYAPFSPLLQSASCWFQHAHLRCLRHSSSRGFLIVSIMDALNRGLDGDPEYSTFLHCKCDTSGVNTFKSNQYTLVKLKEKFGKIIQEKGTNKRPTIA